MFGIALPKMSSVVWLPKIEQVKISGAVSPAARATASTVPVTIPPSALGSTTPTTVRQRATPSASAASRRWPGTSSSISWPARAISGTMMMASATAAANPLWWWPATSGPNANSPMTTDGRPVMRSSASRIAPPAQRQADGDQPEEARRQAVEGVERGPARAAGPRAGELRHVDRDGHGERRGEQRGHAHDQRGADDRRRDPAAGAAEQRRRLGQEVE